MKIFKYLTMSLVASFALCACSDDDDWAPGEQDTADKAGVYFPSSNETTFEVEPTESQMEFKVARLNTSGALSVPLTVTANDDDVFEIPATANFNAGEAETTVVVDYSKAAEGTTYSFTVSVPEEYRSLYKEFDGGLTYTSEVTKIKWSEAEVGYFVDGTFSRFWGVDNTLAYVVEIQKAELPSSTRYRFVLPFSYVATAMDELGAYVGYPYNSEGDCDEQEHLAIINVTSAGASLTPVSLGVDWGYGEFSIGQIYGYVSSSISNYPLGVYHESAGYIEFPANSLYISMADYQSGGKYPCTNPTYVFLSAEAYTNYLASQAE